MKESKKKTEKRKNGVRPLNKKSRNHDEVG